MRQSIVKSACISGLDITSPDVEVTVSSGLPYYRVVGLGDSAVRESGQRVKLALKSSGFRWPDRKITVNLSPAWMNKKGSAFDLPIALGILQAQGEIHPDLKLSAWGELGSDGKIKTVPSALCYADALAGDPERIVIQPEEAEAVLRPYHRGGLYAAHLNEIKALLQEEALEHYQAYELKRHPGEGFFRQERGEEEKFPLHLQEAAWRAVMISAAGAHHLMLEGAAGCGKTTLARAARYLLPPLSEEVLYAYALNRALADPSASDQSIFSSVPFRAPHHSVTAAALLGGSRRYPVGEAALADCGFLFLDEISEYSSATLNMLRQPAEDHYILRHRDGKIYRQPSRFILLAAANPCPCGLLYETEQSCSCRSYDLKRYRKKFSNPFYDRISLWTQMLRLKSNLLSASVEKSDFDFEDCRRKVRAARERQKERQGKEDEPFYYLNAVVKSDEPASLFLIDKKVLRTGERLAEELKLSIRSYQQLLRAARSIADLENEERVREEHLLEAFTYKRQKDEVK